MAAEIERHTGEDTTAVPAATTSAGAMRLVDWSHEASAAYHLAKGLVHTPFAGSWRGDEMGAAAAILKGSEIGLTPVTALSAFDNIQGTPAPKAITLRALVQSHGHDLEIVEETDQRAVARYRRNGKGDWQTTDFTIDEARQLGLTDKHNWKKQPRAMLVARVTSKAARMVASDVILGIGYSAEEVRDFAGPERPATQIIAAAPAQGVDAIAGDDETGEAMTDRSRGEMFALFGRKGIAEDEQLSGINHICHTDYTSRGDLTEADALTVIAALRKRPDVDVPLTEEGQA